MRFQEKAIILLHRVHVKQDTPVPRKKKQRQLKLSFFIGFTHPHTTPPPHNVIGR